MFISPTHFYSLLEKNGLEKTSENLYKCGTGRFEQISTFLAHRTELLQDEIKIEATSTENVNHRLIQISGK